MTGLAFNRLKETRSISISLGSIRVFKQREIFFHYICVLEVLKILTVSANVMYNEALIHIHIKTCLINKVNAPSQQSNISRE